MTQATATKLAVEVKNCAACPYFDDFHESNGRGWCKLFNRFCREHHKITNNCIVSSDLIVSVELKDNLDIFSDIDLEAFPTEEIVDEADKPDAEYEVGSIVKIIDAEEDHAEWGVFEVIECMYNQNFCDGTLDYLKQSEWYYRLRSYQDGNTMPSNNSGIDESLWVAENEICAFDMSWNVCTDDIF